MGKDMTIVFPELKFSAAHYVPGHEKCGAIHGHTYYVRKLKITLRGLDTKKDGYLDFGVIKKYFKEHWGHSFIIPQEDYEFWINVLTAADLRNNLHVIKGKPLVEEIQKVIIEDLKVIVHKEFPNMVYEYSKEPSFTISFGLYEGPDQGVHVSG